MEVEKKILKRYKIASLILLTLAVVLSGLVFWMQVNSKMSNNERMLSASLTKKEVHLSLLEMLREATFQYAIDGDIDVFFKAYQRVQDLDTLNLFSNLDKEIEKISKQIELQNAGVENSLLTQKRLQQSLTKIQTLEAQIEGFAEEIDRQSEQHQTRLDSLKNVIASQKQQLNKRDRIRVITFKTDNGNLVHYLGEVSNDKANGNGVGIWSTGSIYRGEWKDNKRHGEGEFTWADGDSYKGDFFEGKVEGTGTYSWRSGEKYVGEFSNSRRNGQGILYDPDGNVSFEGLWKNDKPQTKN